MVSKYHCSIVCSTVYSGADQRKPQSSAFLAFVRGIHWWPVDSPHKGPVTQKCFHLISCHETPQRQGYNRPHFDSTNDSPNLTLSGQLWLVYLGGKLTVLMDRTVFAQCLTHGSLGIWKYRQVSDIRCIVYQQLKDSCTVLRLSLSNPLKPDVKSRMKM